jgi:hypothetical protein
MSIVLGFPCDEVADYLLTMEAPEAMREHIESFAGENLRQISIQRMPAVPNRCISNAMRLF